MACATPSIRAWGASRSNSSSPRGSLCRVLHSTLKSRRASPRFQGADSGRLHRLLGLDTLKALEGHPKVGASWEGFLLGEVVQRLAVQPDQCWFWRTHAGAELDLLVIRGRERLGFEFKRTVAPALTPSMRSALQDLKLDRLDVIHAGGETFPPGPRVRAVAASRLLEDL